MVVRHRPRGKRHKVVLRKKVRNRRLTRFGFAAAFLLLGGWAALTLRHVSGELPSAEDIAAFLVPGHIEIAGLPPSLEATVRTAIVEESGGLASRLDIIKGRFPMIRSIDASRMWFQDSIRLRFDLHKAVGVSRKGRQTSYLSADGTLFKAPKEFYPDDFPKVELGRAESPVVKKLAAYLEFVHSPDSFVSPLRRMSFVSDAEGWEARLEDGTRILWGDLRWTSEKLMRLKQVLDDVRSPYHSSNSRSGTSPTEGAAGGRSSGPFGNRLGPQGGPQAAGILADMRYFEDGKILVRKVP